jgi:hypothetical protein
LTRDVGVRGTDEQVGNAVLGDVGGRGREPEQVALRLSLEARDGHRERGRALGAGAREQVDEARPGAIGGHLDSCSACDLRGGTWSAEALKRGITATFGAVNEPYVAGMPEYDQLFLYLTRGANFGEAAYESTQLSLWMMVFVGDPLYRPFP